MLMNSFFLNKKMLIFQIIVLFSNFEYYASHPSCLIGIIIIINQQLD